MTIPLIVFAAILLVVIAWLTLEYSILVPPKRGLAILLYHKISNGNRDALTVTADDLELHFAFLKERGYHVLSFRELKELIRDGASLPRKAVIITFDDAYRDFRTLVMPMLKKFDLKATVFVPLAYIGKANIWDKGNDPVMDAEELKQISGDPHVEIGLHSFLHKSYGDMAITDMEEDLDNCFSSLSFYNIRYVRVLAYPYGGYPKKDPILKEQMISLFKTRELDFALRIGNRINSFPPRRPFELKRIDIKGSDNFFIFRTKLRKGRAKLFS
ncbi:MAG: polysaccharide deacetylase family protein [bacterium]